MMPLGSVVSLRRITGPYRVLRYQLYPAAEVQADTPPAIPTGQTMAAMERIARKMLPAGYGYEWTDSPIRTAGGQHGGPGLRRRGHVRLPAAGRAV